MQLVINNLNEETLRQLSRMAELSPRSVEEEAAVALDKYCSRREAITKMNAFREELLAKRGGELFSDSTELIRESRENDW